MCVLANVQNIVGKIKNLIRVSHWERKLWSRWKGGLFTALPIQESITSFLPLAKLYLVRPWTLCRSRAFCSWSLSVFLPFRPGSRYGESSPNLHFSLLPRSQGSWTIIKHPSCLVPDAFCSPSEPCTPKLSPLPPSYLIIPCPLLPYCSGS